MSPQNNFTDVRESVDVSAYQVPGAMGWLRWKVQEFQFEEDEFTPAEYNEEELEPIEEYMASTPQKKTNALERNVKQKQLSGKKTKYFTEDDSTPWKR